jgi:hypothetical protein
MIRIFPIKKAFVRRDRDLSVVLLILSIILLIVGLTAAIIAGLAFDCCFRKVINTFYYENLSKS